MQYIHWCFIDLTQQLYASLVLIQSLINNNDKNDDDDDDNDNDNGKDNYDDDDNGKDNYDDDDNGKDIYDDDMGKLKNPIVMFLQGHVL